MERTKLHLLVDMIVRALCAANCGAEGWADVERFGKKKKDWFARFVELSTGKTLWHSSDTASGRDALQLLNA
jgi:hypothetical protein